MERGKELAKTLENHGLKGKVTDYYDTLLPNKESLSHDKAECD